MQEIAEKLRHLKIQRFVQIIVLAAIERLRRRRKSKRKSKISSSSHEDEYKSSQTAAAMFDNKFDHACVFASYCKLFAFPARTLEDNRQSCQKLFNMLNIRRWWQACRKSLKTSRTPEKLAYANSHEWNFAKLIALVCGGLKWKIVQLYLYSEKFQSHIWELNP